MARTILTLTIALMLAACGGGKRPASRASADGAANGITVGTLHDGTALTVGQGAAAGKGLLLVYFATW